MYEYVEGELVSKSPTTAVIDAGGVGYRLHIPLSTYRRLPDKGRTKLLTHFYLREDTQRLYGFATDAERDVFSRLLSVPKVGPVLALAVLSGLSLAQLRDAVENRRPEILSRVKGIGPATAERLVQELHRDPLPGLGAVASLPSGPAADTTRDAVSALLTLGYQRSSAERAADKALKKLGQDASLEDVVTEALRAV